MHFTEVFILFVMTVILVMYIQNHYGEVDYVVAHTDGRRYLVRKLPDAQEAAEMLASINADLVRLVRYMHAKHGTSNDDARSLYQNFNPNAVSEGSPESGYTSMTINKGEKVILCLRQTNKQFVSKNVVMYVAIHELAHIMTFKEKGHPPKFWENFKLLLSEAIDLGIYTKVDFGSKPADYCGIKITSSII
jgi:hypothetical protein